MNLGLEKLSTDTEAAERMADEALKKVEDLKKTAATNSKLLEKKRQENVGLKNELEDIKSQYVIELDNIVSDAKKSAARTVLQARILMIEEIANNGFDTSGWDLRGWWEALVVLGGEAMEKSGASEKA